MANGGSMSQKVTYQLKKPLVQGSEVINQLEFSEPKLKHLKKLDGSTGDFNRTAKMIEILCNIRPGLVDEIDPVDLPGIGEVIQTFFPDAPKTS